MTWVKICGLSDPAHAKVAVAAGADAVGFVVHAASPRNVTIDQARAVVRAADGAPAIAVLVSPAAEAAAAIVDATGAGGVQLHGDLGEDVLPSLRRRFPGLLVLRAQRIAPGVTSWPKLSGEGADVLLLDAHVEGVHGGTGQRLVWQRPYADVPVVLAGGLTAENVSEAIAAAAPYGVDVSSGVETEPGRKDARRIAAFVQAVRSADDRG